MTEITELTGEYLEAVAELDRKVFPYSPWGKESFAENIRNGYDHPLIALTDGVLSGYGILRVLSDGEILLLGVDPSFRRKGIGEAILSEMMALSGEAEKILLEVREGNTAARRLYEKKGFREIARRKDYYRDPVEDAVIMMG